MYIQSKNDVCVSESGDLLEFSERHNANTDRGTTLGLGSDTVVPHVGLAAELRGRQTCVWSPVSFLEPTPSLCVTRGEACSRSELGERGCARSSRAVPPVCLSGFSPGS